MFFHQIGEVVEIARALPDLNVVLWYCGGPLGTALMSAVIKRSSLNGGPTWPIWQRARNVSVKLGGMLMRLATYDYLNVETPVSSEALEVCLRPYVLGCIDLFGADRCMFESNFPVEKMVTGYEVLWNAFKRITCEAAVDEACALQRHCQARLPPLLTPSLRLTPTSSMRLPGLMPRPTATGRLRVLPLPIALSGTWRSH